MADAAARPANPQHLVVGHITKAHGTRGELMVWPLTDRPDSVFAEGTLLLVGDEDGAVGEDARSVVVERSRPFKKGLLVKLEDAGDRGAVESLLGRYLLADMASLAPLEEGEVFYHQLLGLAVVRLDGREVGRVREVFESVPADLLEVVMDGGRTILVPFAEAIVREVDLERGRLVIDPPEGLLEL